VALLYVFTWISAALDNYVNLCVVSFDATEVNKSLKKCHGLNSRIFFKIAFAVILRFGLTELTAEVSWTCNVSVEIVPLDHNQKLNVNSQRVEIIGERLSSFLDFDMANMSSG
jgi:hypothetical protein